MGKDPRPGSLQADSIAPPPKRRALALKEMRMKVIQSCLPFKVPAHQINNISPASEFVPYIQRKLLPTRSQPTERLQTGQPSITDLIDGMEEPTTGVPEPAYPAIPDRTFRTSLSSSATGSDRVDSDGMASSTRTF
ncbi:hypothetical protein Q3G72_032453 [Acer saccharum]|nr:hypothetical protein Q3G72_032453 [Acer saccharum]